MRRTYWRVVSLPALVAGSVLSPSGGADPPPDAKRDIPKEVRALAGTYAGAWTMYGIDEKGEVVKRMAWTDTMTAGRPEVKGDRAYVTTADEMTFDGAKGPPFKVEGAEGYYLAKGGGLGDSFIEAHGQVHRLAKLGDDVWTYAAPAAEQDLARLGFPKGASGRHVVVKVVTTERGVETHRVSRVTTVSWKDKGGTERALQFVSLQGYHKRQS
jgi:hypothetical protein